MLLFISSCVAIPIETASESEASAVEASVIAESSVDESKSEHGEPSSEESVEESLTVSDVSEESSVEQSETSFEQQISFEYDIDIEPYLQYIVPENESEYLVLVNYESRLTKDDKPDDLVKTAYSRYSGDDAQKLRLYCEKALEAFLKEASLNGVKNVSVTSGYRSFATQKYLFNKYCEQEMAADKSLSREECEEIVMTYSCKEGCSEHQSGLAVDMHNLKAADVSFAKTKEYTWLSENAHRFGFILRFPKEKENITNITFEPWHYRFVGRDAATYIHENGMCLEEYIALMTESERDS